MLGSSVAHGLLRFRLHSGQPGRFFFEFGTLRGNLAHTRFFLAARLRCDGSLLFSLCTLARLFHGARFRLDPGAGLHIGLMFRFDAVQGQRLQLALSLNARLGRSANAVFGLLARLGGYCGNRFDALALLGGLTQFKIGLQAQLQRRGGLTFGFGPSACGGFLFLLGQCPGPGLFAGTHFGGRAVERGFQCDGFGMLALARNFQRFAACLRQLLGILPGFLFETLALARHFGNACVGTGTLFRFLSCCPLGSSALGGLPAREFSSVRQLFRFCGSALGQLGIGGHLFGGTPAGFFLGFGARFGYFSCLFVGFGTRAQLGDFLFDGGSLCFAGFTRLTFRFKTCLAGGNGLLGGLCILIGLGGSGGIGAGAVFRQCAGARFGMSTVFGRYGCLGFGFDARNRGANRM